MDFDTFESSVSHDLIWKAGIQKRKKFPDEILKRPIAYELANRISFKKKISFGRRE